MTLSEYSSAARRDIAEAIEDRLFASGTSCAGFSGDSGRIFSVMKDYILSGKMLRGILACLSSELFSAGIEESALRRKKALGLAAALEFFQAGLLVHDDIMDKDEMRRGKPTMHKTFERIEAAQLRGPAGADPCAANLGAADPDTADLGAAELGAAGLGEAIGICAGDIYYFIAWQLISYLGQEIGKLFSRELVDVCLAQIKDVRLGSRREIPVLEETIEVYTYKTARYTICLPLCAGALVAGRADAIPALEALGLNLGILFQLQDDYLGLFGDEEELGKPVGSDIREGKKTPFMILLTQALEDTEKPGFYRIFGNQDITRQDVDHVRSLVRAHGIDTQVRALSAAYARKAEQCLAELSRHTAGLDSEKLGILQEFIDYSLSRKF